MTGFEELDHYIARDFNPDYWYDDAHTFAWRMIASFTPSDWAALTEAWRLRTVGWQNRCAYALIGGPAAEAADILTGMALSPDEDVASTAVDALIRLRWEEKRPLVSPDLSARLANLAASCPMSARSIDTLRQMAAG